MRINYLLSFLLLVAMCQTGFSQTKTYGQVYYSVKNGNDWGGLIKTSFGVSLTNPEEGLYQISMSGTSNIITVKYEAMNSEGRAFHTISKLYNISWKGPAGQTEINWVFLNKDIAEIFTNGVKPWDLELQFSDGSAVKYYMSQKY